MLTLVYWLKIVHQLFAKEKLKLLDGKTLIELKWHIKYVVISEISSFVGNPVCIMVH